MKLSIFFLFTLLSWHQVHSVPVAGQCSAFIGSCEYYSCREELNHCGRKGYFEEFAYPYCNQVDQNISTFSQQGVEWAEKTKVCLQESVEAIPSNASCSKIAITAMRAHSYCYVKSGYCTLQLEDRLKIFELFKRALFNPVVFREAIQVIQQCE